MHRTDSLSDRRRAGCGATPTSYREYEGARLQRHAWRRTHDHIVVPSAIQNLGTNINTIGAKDQSNILRLRPHRQFLFKEGLEDPKGLHVLFGLALVRRSLSLDRRLRGGRSD